LTSASAPSAAAVNKLELSWKGPVLRLHLGPTWAVGTALPAEGEIAALLDSKDGVERLEVDGARVSRWDTALLILLERLDSLATARALSVDWVAIPIGAERLLRLAKAVPERQGARRGVESRAFLVRVGTRALASRADTEQKLNFLGEVALAFGRLLRGRAQFRLSDFLLTVQEVGAQALGIVALISFLVGLILAYVGAAQLRQFGAQIYVADLVALGMARAMGAMMTGIIMAGRTGAAFAAQLGTMQVNEEVDALKTFGFAPMDFLVLPRMLALMLMMPLLCLYSDLMGVLGGAVVGIAVFDLDILEYLRQTQRALDLVDISVGLVNSAVYGVLVAFAGCFYGIRCGRSSSAVGEATTSAVVTGILYIIIATAVLTVIYDVLGI
jgi:phospholipid/cholesterol/gamma-HCH transport system permease protein